MKKLFMIAIAGLFFFASCGNKPVTPAEEPVKEECNKEQCCKELTEEQKAEMEAWNDWDNQTDEKKAELLANRKACIDQKMAEKKECKKEGEEPSEECKAKCAERQAKWDSWATLTMDEQKALIDEFGGCCKKECAHGEGEGCCKGEGEHAEGGCEHKK